MSLRSASATIRFESVFIGILLAILTLVFWKVRIVDFATIQHVGIGSADLYTSFYPRTSYAFGTLRTGKLPLWNPYQLCGKPLLATPAAGVFYPLNFVYLVFDVDTAIEISFLLHMLLGALGMFYLMRHFGVGTFAALCSAVTFVWSGWLIDNANQPVLFAGMMWMPLTALLLDRVLQGARLAWLPLGLAVTCQVFNGATEIFVHVLYVGMSFAIVRLGALIWRGHRLVAFKRGGVVLASIGTGVLLSAPQLLPSIELVRLSARAPGALSWSEARQWSIPALLFLHGALSTQTAFHLEKVTVGLLPLLGVGLVLGFPRHRVAWICGVALAVGAAFLVFGGPAFRLYYESPVGGMFRRPMKFLDIYAFGQALVAGVAIARLESWTRLPRRELWTRPAWLTALTIGVAALSWLTWSGWSNPYLIAMLVLFVLFGISAAPRFRLFIIVGLCVLQGVTLFFTVGNKRMRPSQRPNVFQQVPQVMTFLREHAGYERVYLPPTMLYNPALTVKQGMLNRINVLTDYDPLSVQRYANFFDRVTGTTSEQFAGLYRLGPETDWRLLNLTGTKYLVLDRREADRLLTVRPKRAGLRLAYTFRALRVYENLRSQPRAYFVPRARMLDDPEQVLNLLDSPRFDPRTVVLLEETPAEPPPPVAPSPERAISAQIVRYEPERVSIAVDAPSSGFLVLTDLFYPGWKAFVDDREVPVYRANYLFRAVQVPRGHHQVRFEYRPASFHRGLVLSGATALIIVTLLAWAIRTRVRSDGWPGRRSCVESRT